MSNYDIGGNRCKFCRDTDRFGAEAGPSSVSPEVIEHANRT